MDSISRCATAIIVQKKERRLAMLTHDQGMLACNAYDTPAILGSLVRCTLQRRGAHTIASELELMDLPLELARADLLFFHHVLELCAILVPIGSRAPELFTMLQSLYSQWDSRVNDLCKKLFLCKMIISAGMYETLPKIDGNVLSLVLGSPVDMARWSTIELDSRHELDRWLLSCIANYAVGECFKTVHFLTVRR